jgi:putative intracellular protease/amidase
MCLSYVLGQETGQKADSEHDVKESGRDSHVFQIGSVLVRAIFISRRIILSTVSLVDMVRPLKVLIPAYRDFDPTEIAVPWKLLKEWGATIPDGIVEVTFTTIDGQPAECDSLVLRGPIFGFFGASKEATKAYREMIKSEEFLHPLRWEDTDFDAYDGVWLGGGHAKGVREYLESEVLQSKLANFMPKTDASSEDPKVLAAICHGPVLLSRTVDEAGKSVLAGRKTSCLPYHMERDAYYVSQNTIARDNL